MAERRMFTKKITDDDHFVNLSSSAQALYFHLSMSADDDGFCNQVTLAMFRAHASIQDLEALLRDRYIYQFENGVIVIKHWRMANALRKDRYTPTAFKEEMARLRIEENGAYTMSLEMQETEPDNENKRKLAYENSTLPYSFDYKIKQAFWGRKCPVCGALMQTHNDDGIVTKNHIPTIQHNIPLSKGGEHELGNISVICHECNVRIQDQETGELNASEVTAEWEKISGCRLVASCLPQDRIGKNSIDQNNNTSTSVLVRGTSEEDSTPFEQVRKAWNELSDVGINAIRTITEGSTRAKMLRARIKQYGIDSVIEAIGMIRQSSFLLGNSKRGWSITFDWFIKPNNFPKVLEGNYSDKDSSIGKPTGTVSKNIKAAETIMTDEDWEAGGDNV